MQNNHHKDKEHHTPIDSSIQCLNEVDATKISKGHRLAERSAEIIGSWNFIIIQSVILVFWAFLNILAWFEHWDPYPFILLNLFLAIQAAYAGPVIMMSQNRQAARDRLEAHNDYLVNIKAEQEIRALAKKLAAQTESIHELKQLIQTLQKNNL